MGNYRVGGVNMIDWNNPQQVALFRQTALSQGKDAKRIDEFIALKNTMKSTAPQIPETKPISEPIKKPAIIEENPIILDVSSTGFTSGLTPKKEEKPTGIVAFNANENYLPSELRKPKGEGVFPETLPKGKNDSIIMADDAPITQKFGNYNPQYEVFSGGVNYGTDFGIPEGTSITTPQGEWEVVESFSGARRGYIGDGTNQGYGNSVVIQNRMTGEKMRFSHLSQVVVKPGELVKKGTLLGKSGSTGNSSGDHLDLEYYNSRGEPQDILQSPYRRYL